jgi:tol-pal system protein YbgF
LGLAFGAPPALAQRLPDLPQPAVPDPVAGEFLDNKGIERRLERDEKALRDLRQIVLQSKAQGNPVVVKDAGPDPEVLALQQRVNDLEETLRRQTGQLEVLLHDAQLAAAAVQASTQTNQALGARLDNDEHQLQALVAAAQAAQAPPAPPPSANAGSGVLGTLPEGGPAPGGDAAQAPAESEAQAYRAARRTLDGGDYAGGAAALQDYLQRYPGSPRAAEANYWLGRTLALRNMHAEAAAAYARALRGWPKSEWAADAVVRLAASLVELKRGQDACKALAEYQTRYGSRSAPALRTRAREVRAAAACG